MYLQNRPRILRQSDAIRDMVCETHLHPSDFILPIFITEGSNIKEEIFSMPQYYRYSLNLIEKEVKELWDLGLRSVLLFTKVSDHLKDNTGKESYNPHGLMQRSIKHIKNACPEIVVMTDVALDPYSIYGHDGIVENEIIVNDKTVEALVKMSISHAQAGADIVAPSDMMDGRIIAIRKALEEMNLHCGIMSYSAKYASCLYGPFRDALDSKPGFGDKKTYQMNPANRIEAIKETKMDMLEGADIVMVKPAGFYLDIIREIKNISTLPVSTYQVSGEYAMIKASAEKGWIEEKKAIIESLLSIKRAGADLITTYFTKEILQMISHEKKILSK
ncbi:MAG: porphobilinogen synthase [Chitinophagaceae bacterium]